MVFRHIRLAAALCAAFAALLVPATASAAPANDNFENAALLEGGAGITYGNTYGSTHQAGEECIWSCGSSVWYKWTAAASGSVNFNTCSGTNYDSTLTVYTGNGLGQLSRVAWNDDSSCGSWWSYQSSVWLNANAGTQYFIRVGGWNGHQGSYGLTFPAGRASDSTPPALTVPSPVTAEATGPSGASVTYTASAHDAVDGARPVSCTPASGSTFPIGTTTVNCSSSDAAGNVGHASFAVSVVDTTAPTVTVPGRISTEATGAAGAIAEYTATAHDTVGGARSVTCSPASGSTFPIGTTTVNCSSSDAAGNVGSASFPVSVVDTTAPALTVSGNLAATATSAAGSVVTFDAPTATDLVDGTVIATCGASSGATFGPGLTTVTCSATDAAGNTARSSFAVNVTFAWSNLLAPINVDGSSVFKLGSTVPVKFRLTGASAPVLDATARIYLTKVSDSVIGTEVEAVSTSAATTGNLFRVSDGQYIFNLSTKPLEAGTWRVRVDLGDGVARSVAISLR